MGRLHRLAMARGPGWGLTWLLRRGESLAAGTAWGDKIKGQNGGCDFSWPVNNCVAGTYRVPRLCCLRWRFMGTHDLLGHCE